LTSGETAELMKGHMAHLGAMGKRGLVGAGPLVKAGDLRGVLIFHGPTVEQATKMASEDPVVTQGQMVVELHPWRGPAGIGERYQREHAADPAAKVNMMKVKLLLVRGRGDAGPEPDGGPILDESTLRAVAVLRTLDMEEARATVAARHPGFTVEAFEWLVADGVMP